MQQPGCQTIFPCAAKWSSRDQGPSNRDELSKLGKVSFTNFALDRVSCKQGSICYCRYEAKRRVRVGVIHGLARMAAIMATTYKPYLGEGLGPLSVRSFSTPFCDIESWEAFLSWIDRARHKKFFVEVQFLEQSRLHNADYPNSGYYGLLYNTLLQDNHEDKDTKSNV